MNIKDSYVHNGASVLKDIKIESSVLKKILAGVDANGNYLDWTTVLDLTTIKPTAAGTADKVGHKLTFSGGVTGDWDGSADKTVAIPTKSSWNYDDVYVKLAGSTMTGVLNINADTPGLLVLKRTSSNGGAFIDYYPMNQTAKYWRVGSSSTMTEFRIGIYDNSVYTKVAEFTNLGQLTLSAAQGTAPLVISSTTKVANLNADLLDGHDSSYFATAASLGDYVTLAGTQTISGNKTFSSSVSIDDLTAGNLVVTGAASFAQTINGNIATADKVNHNLTIQLNSGTTEGTNKFTFNGSAAKSINITPSAIGAKATQSAVSDPTASGNGISYIATISQNAQGVITATKSTVRSASTSQSGVVTTGEQSFAGNKTFTGNLTVENITPSANVTKDNGSSTNCWNNVYTKYVVSNTTLYIQNAAGSSIIFKPQGTERARFNTSGNFVLGHSSPNDITDYLLYVNGSFYATSMYLNGTALSSAATHAHGDYVTSLSWDSTNSKLAWSKGGTAQTAIAIGYATAAGKATNDSDGNAINSTYLKLSGGTMTGAIKMSTSYAITSTSIPDTEGYAMLLYNSGTVVGAFGNGTTADMPTYIRSTGDNLYHRKGKTGSYNDYKIWDENNLTTSAAASGGTTKSLVTTGDKYKWNLVYDWLTTTTADTDTTINKWKELEAFLTSITESDTLSGLLAGRVAKSGDTMTGALTTPGLTVTGTATFSQAIDGSILGNAATASRLQNTRTLKVALGSTSAQSFDGSANAQSIGVSGTLPIANGGTGTTSQANININIVAALSEGSSDVTDNTELITSYASNNGFADTNATNVMYKRDAIKIFNYIKNKLTTSGNQLTLDNVPDGSTRKLSNYLPLNGGVLQHTGSTVGQITTTTPLYVRGDSSNQAASIAFGWGDSAAAWLGYSNAEGLYVWYNSARQKIWNAANDGSGSGLDADKLDGQEGSYYATASSLGSYLPLAGGTMTGAINFDEHNSATDLSKGLNFGAVGHLGYSTGLGLYSSGNIWIRPAQTIPASGSFTTNSYGLVITSSSFTYNGNTILDSSNSSVSLSDQTLSVKINGTTQSLTNTDVAVKQSQSTTTNYRGIVLGYNSNSTANSGITDTVYGGVYTSNNIVVQPSTGNLISLGSVTVPKIRISGKHSSSNTSNGIYYYDGTDDYLLIGQGTSNLWIGANETAGTHHTGKTYISTGNTNNEPLYVSKLVDNTRTNFAVIDANNYNSYSPTLTGTGASGTWGINITGSAGSLSWNKQTSSSQTKNVSSAGWTQTDTATPSSTNYGTYVVQLKSGDYYYSGVFSAGSTDDGTLEEIPLHSSAPSQTRLYLGTKNKKFYISSGHSSETSITFTIVYQRLL